MKKRIALAALFFFVAYQVMYVPAAHANIGASASLPYLRVLTKSASPAMIGGGGLGMSLLAPMATAAGICYVLYKSGAIDAVSDWFNQWNASPIKEYTKSGITYQAFWSTEGGNTYCEIKRKSDGVVYTPYQLAGTGTSWSDTWKNNWVLAKLGAGGAYSGETASRPDSNSTFDPSSWATAPPFSFPSSSVYATPNSGITGNESASSPPVWMTDSQANDFIERNGLQEVADDGTVPNPSDNATLDAKTLVPYLNQIQTNTANLSKGMDCAVVQLNAAREVLASSDRFLDNISNQIKQDAINDQARADNLVNTLTHAEATVATQSVRMQSLRDAAATKFPFSVFSAYDDPSGVGITSPVLGMPDIILPNGDHVTTSFPISIDPLFELARDLFKWLILAGTAILIIRRAITI